MLIRILTVVRTCALALFLGGGAAIAFIVAPTAFHQLAPDRAAAGSVVGACLRAFEWASLGLLGAGLAASLLLRFRRAPSILADVSLALLLAGTLFLRLYLTPALADARPRGTEAGSEFDRLHKAYTQVFGVELLMALAAIALTTASRRPEAGS
ncbi:MAG: DUF4149 domain-containing protein [Planctomycetes bacterium]|nr:DUF4149 domain-containing protein [Planctomycetota bacterium]